MPSTYPSVRAGGTDAGGLVPQQKSRDFREPRYDELDSPKCPVEQLSDIHEATIRTLNEAYGSLSAALNKIRGPKPDKGSETNTTLASPYMMGDSLVMRELARDILSQTMELHTFIGHNK